MVEEGQTRMVRLGATAVLLEEVLAAMTIIMADQE